MTKDFGGVCICLCLAIHCFAESTIMFTQPQYSITEKTHCINFSTQNVGIEETQFKKFVQAFFLDSIYQRSHIIYPLTLSYWEEQDINNESSYIQATILIPENNYQILKLDARSIIKIYESANPYIIVSVPDTALEAELYFQRKTKGFFLIKINITGDASPFN